MNEATTVSRNKRPVMVSGLTPYTGTFGREQLIHLLKRTMFGSTKADIDFFAGKPLTEVLNTLMTIPPAPTTLPLRYYAARTGLADDPAPLGASWVDYKEDPNYNSNRVGSFKQWWAGQMVNQTRSINEKMVLFWHNHFATETDVTTALMSYWGQEVLRRNALGNFKTMVKEVTFNPNMLRYLNGYLNKKSAPDENYGRELQELFCVGKGPNSLYTEDDVKASAKVLTGWSLRAVADTVDANKAKWEAYFVPNNHDTGNKIFSSFYGGLTISGSPTVNTEANATREITEMITMLLNTQEAALHICRKIYRYFVYYDIDATIESTVISPMAAIFRQNYDIIPVLKALLGSDHFFELGQKACIIKSPLEFIVGFVREFNVEFPLATDYVFQYTAWNKLVSSGSNGAAAQGQDLADPPNVAGWPAYYQEPVFHEFWINTDTFGKRLSFIDAFLTTNGVSLGSGKKIVADVLKFTDQFGAAANDPVQLIDLALEILYRVPPTAAMKAYLKTTILLGGQAQDHYWTDAWTAYKATPTTANTLTVTTRLMQFYKFIVDSPEFQLS